MGPSQITAHNGLITALHGFPGTKVYTLYPKSLSSLTFFHRDLRQYWSWKRDLGLVWIVEK